MRKLFPLLILMFSASLFAAPKQAPQCAPFQKAVASGTASQKLKRFGDAQWKYLMTEFPEYATYTGYPGQNDRWTDDSLEANERRDKEVACMLAAAQKIPRASLKPRERVTYDLIVRELKLDLEGQRFPDDFMPVNQMDGIQVDTVQLFMAMPTSKKKDYEDILKRLESLPVVVDQTIVLMREGVKRKVTPVKAFMEQVLPQVDELTKADVEESPLYTPFKEMNSNLSKEDQAALRGLAKEILSAKVYPAFKKFREFLVKEYIPASREFIAFSDLPDGKAWYAYKVKDYTTTDMTPDQLHDLGLKEVDRITAEMEKIREKVKFKGDLKAFNEFMKTDKRFHFTKEEDLLAGYRDIAKRIDAELPKMFKTLPRLTYGVRPIPAYQAPTSAGARYIGGSLEAGRPGWFEANTYDLKSRPKWDMETLTFHEAVPGHHFQIALAREIPDLPEIRRYRGYTAYSEGWALYAESLGDEMGFYKDPYSKYGNLSAEMMRAVRLVVDTGMHAKGWSKEKALAYYRSKFPTSDTDSESEINRYISWPGQALAYKVGQLKFRELRESSRAALGDAFDVREFHDEVLRHGALPMDVLEKTVKDWTSSKKKSIKRL